MSANRKGARSGGAGLPPDYLEKRYEMRGRELDRLRRERDGCRARLLRELVETERLQALDPSVDYWAGRVSGLRLALDLLDDGPWCVGCFLTGGLHAPGCPTGQNGSPRYE